MKNLLLSGAVLFSLAIGSVNASAASLDIQYLMLDTDFEGVSLEPSALQLKVANPVAPNISIEGVLAFGITDDDISVTIPPDTLKFGLELANLLGVYAKAHADLGSNSQIYGRIGFTKIEYDITATITSGGSSISGTVSDDDTGIAFGFGALFALSPQSGLVVEYNQYPDVDFEGLNIETTSLSVGYQMNF